MKKRIFVLGLLVFSCQFLGFGQELKYMLQKGQVLQYEHVFEKKDNYRGNERIQQRIQALEFEVISIQRNKYLMNLKVVSSYKKTKFSDGVYELDTKVETAFDSTASTLINYADQGRIIEFEMDTWGKILNIQGLDEFQHEVALKIHSHKRSAFKALVPYGYLISRISAEYYTQLINDIFPEINNLNDLSIKEKKVWQINTREIHTKHKWLPNNENNQGHYTFEQDFYNCLLDYPDSIISYKENQSGEIIWDEKHKTIRTLAYSTIDYMDMISQNWRDNYFYIIGIKKINPREIKYQAEVRVRRLGDYQTYDKPAHIIGEIKGCDSCKIVVRLPSGKLSPDIRVFDIDQQGHSINFSGDLPYGSDLITIFFPEDYDLFKSYENDPRQIRLFVRPGDTVRFSVDLRKFGETMGFFGTTWKEQELLNSYILGYSNLHPQITLSEIHSAQVYYRRNKELFCEEFQKWFEFESLYESLEYRLNEIRGPNISAINFNPEDSLKSFSKYLNNYDGYKSEAYKRFIKRMVGAFSSKANYQGLNSDPYTNMLQSVGIVLNGWDKYYALADLTDARMKIFYYPISQQYYKFFIRSYRGSEYGNYLENQWEFYSKILPGERVPDFNFKDVHGNQYSIRDFWGQVITLTSMSKIKTNRSRLIPTNIIKETQQKLFAAEIKKIEKPKDWKILYFFTGDSIPSVAEFDSLSGKNRIYITDKKSVQSFLSIFMGRQDLIISIDKDQRIARYNDWPINWNMHYNLRSWPQLEEVIDPPKTINRRTLWLILTIILITGTYIFLKIWDRNKKRESKLALKRKMAELELGAVRSRMNPHFLFNALSSIQNLVNSNELEKANLYLADFGDLLRKILDQSSRNQITLAEEVDTLRTYLELESLRFPFKYTLEVAKDINPQEFEIPPLFIQPHVENAIIHGISGLGDKGVVQIRFELSGGNLEVIVEDNGPGLKKENHSSGLGKGWELTNQRVQLLKNQWGKNISVKMEKLEENSGMRVKFVIPVENMKS